MTDHSQHLRILEAVLFAAIEPLDVPSIAARMPDDADIAALLAEMQGLYANRGVNLVEVGGKWALHTAPDLAPYLRVETTVTRKLSRAAMETLAIIAYHQPATRAEVEEIRGVALAKGTLDILMEAGWIRPKGRRETAGRPVTWVTTDRFLEHFSLASLDDLPGLEELRAAGLLDASVTSYGAPAENESATLPETPETAEGADDVDPLPPLENEQRPQ